MRVFQKIEIEVPDLSGQVKAALDDCSDVSAAFRAANMNTTTAYAVANGKQTSISYEKLTEVCSALGRTPESMGVSFTRRPSVEFAWDTNGVTASASTPFGRCCIGLDQAGRAVIRDAPFDIPATTKPQTWGSIKQAKAWCEIEYNKALAKAMAGE